MSQSNQQQWCQLNNAAQERIAVLAIREVARNLSCPQPRRRSAYYACAWRDIRALQEASPPPVDMWSAPDELQHGLAFHTDVKKLLCDLCSELDGYSKKANGVTGAWEGGVPASARATSVKISRQQLKLASLNVRGGFGGYMSTASRSEKLKLFTHKLAEQSIDIAIVSEHKNAALCTMAERKWLHIQWGTNGRSGVSCRPCERKSALTSGTATGSWG